MKLRAGLLLLTGSSAAAAETKLWYTAPATNWERQAMPIGNGRLSAMVLGDVFVDLAHGAVTAYRHELDLERALHTVTYECGGVRYRREVFVSFSARVVVVRFATDKPGKLTGAARLTDMHNGKVTNYRIASPKPSKVSIWVNGEKKSVTSARL